MNGTFTILDLAVRSGNDALIGLVDEAHRVSPEVSGQTMYLGQPMQIPMVGLSRTIKGQKYKTMVRTAAPTIGFRNANEGTSATGGQYENREVSCHIINPWWGGDKAVLDMSEDGPAAWLHDEALSNLEGVFQKLGTQFYTGTTNDAKGHPGLSASLLAAQTVDAAGTTAATASSVWAVRWGERDVQWVYGENGQMQLSDIREESYYPTSTTRLTKYLQEMLVLPGLQVLRPQAVGKIKNLTADSGKGLTASLLRDLVATFPASRKPNALFLSQRSLAQYAKSLTAYDPDGKPAPTPRDFEGIPLIATENITNTEALS